MCSAVKKTEARKGRRELGGKCAARTLGCRPPAPPRGSLVSRGELTTPFVLEREQERECRGHPLFVDIFMFLKLADKEITLA